MEKIIKKEEHEGYTLTFIQTDWGDEPEEILDNMDEKKVIELLSRSGSAEAWNISCGKIFQYYGKRPGFWYEKVIHSKLKSQTAKKYAWKE